MKREVIDAIESIIRKKGKPLDKNQERALTVFLEASRDILFYKEAIEKMISVHPKNYKDGHTGAYDEIRKQAIQAADYEPKFMALYLEISEFLLGKTEMEVPPRPTDIDTTGYPI